MEEGGQIEIGVGVICVNLKNRFRGDNVGGKASTSVIYIYHISIQNLTSIIFLKKFYSLPQVPVLSLKYCDFQLNTFDKQWRKSMLQH